MKCTLHIALPKLPINQFKPVQFSEDTKRAYCPKNIYVPEGFATPSFFRLKYIPRFPNYSKSTSEIEFRLHFLSNYEKFVKFSKTNKLISKLWIRILLKPHYFKEQSSLSSFFLTPKVIIQVKTGLEYSAGWLHVFKTCCWVLFYNFEPILLS